MSQPITSHSGILSTQPARLPTELWYQCWSNSRRKDLQSLVQVCSLFRHICRQLLFSQLCFGDASIWFQTTPDELDLEYFERLTGRLRMLAQEPARSEIRDMVRECLFEGNRDCDRVLCGHPVFNFFEWAEDLLDIRGHAMNTFVDVLPSFTNLRRIEFAWINVEDNFWLQVSRRAVPSLSELKLADCIVVCSSEVKLELNVLDIAEPWNGGCHGHVSINAPFLLDPAHLTTLILDDHEWAMHVLSSFPSLGVYSRLTSLVLRLNYQCLGKLSQVLEAVPHLLYLKVFAHEWVQDIHFPNAFPLSCVSSLTSFEGPYELAKALVPGRPVTSIALHNTNLDSLHWLSERTLHYLSLRCLPANLDFFQGIMIACPSVRELKIGLNLPCLEDPNFIPLPDIELNVPVPHNCLHSIIQSIVGWIAVGEPKLPPNVEMFYIYHEDGDVHLDDGMADTLVSLLFQNYSRLREISISNRVWRRHGTTWRSAPSVVR